MKQLIFSVFDEKAAAYLPPFFFTTQGQAIRAISDCVSDTDHQFGRHPADYTLFQLGTFDNQSSQIDYEKKPIAALVELIKPDDHPIPLFPSEVTTP